MPNPPILRAGALALIALASPAATRVAHGQVAVVSSTVEERTVAPGETYTATIVVRNLTRQNQPVRVYQRDYMFYADGTSHFVDVGSTPRSNARWITPAVRSLVIPPSSEMTVSYTVQVPSRDSLKGSYWSMIMVEAAPQEAARPSGGRPQLGVGSVMRYGVQIATHIAATGSRQVNFAKSRFLTNPDSTQAFELEVQNAGERAYRPTLWIELYDEQGAMKANVRQERGLLYPGTSLKQTFALGKLPRGSYRAVVFADSGEDAVFASQFSLKY